MYTPADDINLCPGGYVRYYNPCNDINHDLGGSYYPSLGGGVGVGGMSHAQGGGGG